MNEIATATRYSIPIKEIVFNNRVLEWSVNADAVLRQEIFNTTLADKVDFVACGSPGAKAYRITRPEEAEGVLKDVLL